MRKLTVVAAMAAMLLSGATARAEIGLDTGLSTALYGKYVFRGRDAGPVGLVSDLYATYPLNDKVSLTGYVWNYTRLDAGRGIQESDYDGSISYVPGWFDGKLTLTGGFVYYDFCNDAALPNYGGVDTYEVYAGLDYEHWLRPSVYAYYDLANVAGPYVQGNSAGVYVVGSIGHSWDLTDLGIKGWTADADGWIGLDFGRGVDTFNDGGVRLALSTQLEEGLTFGPAVDFWFPSHQIDPNARSFRAAVSLGFSYNKSY